MNPIKQTNQKPKKNHTILHINIHIYVYIYIYTHKSDAYHYSVCVCQPWLVQGFFVHQQLSIPHLQNKGLQFDNREQSLREIDTFNLQQLQVHNFMVNCRCPFFPPLKTKGTESKKGKRRLKSLPQWKRKTIWTKPQFWISACFQPYVWRRIPWKSCHFQSETVSSRLCLLLFTRQVSKKENCWYQQNSIATSITSGASPSTFLSIPYWIILRGFLRFCCHQFYTTHLRISVRGHCRMQLKSEDSNETLRNNCLKYIKKVRNWSNP